jgi:hypothetical protein
MVTPTFSDRFHRNVNWEVEPIYFAIDIYLPVVLILVYSPTAKKTWRVAGELVQIFGTLGEVDIEGGSIILPLNAWKLINFPEIEGQEYYSLKFYPKPWIESFNIEVRQSL